MEELYKAGRIVQPSPGAVPRYKRYLDEMPGLPVQDVWTDINPINSKQSRPSGTLRRNQKHFWVGFSNYSSNNNDLIFDCFCGSGTTAAVAEKLGRRWILLRSRPVRDPHDAQAAAVDPRGPPVCGSEPRQYERQLWRAGAEFGENALPLRSGGSAGGAGEGGASRLAPFRRRRPLHRLRRSPPPRGAGEEPRPSASAPISSLS